MNLVRNLRYKVKKQMETNGIWPEMQKGKLDTMPILKQGVQSAAFFKSYSIFLNLLFQIRILVCAEVQFQFC